MSARHEEAARLLREAYTAGAIPPLRAQLAPTDVLGAYAVQSINTRFWQAQGRRIVGRKAGLTAKAVQQQLGVDQPDFGVLFDDMAVPDGGVLDPARCLQPKAEAEIAFVLAADLPSPETTPDEVSAAVATVHAAIEIVDSRIEGWKIAFADTVADNGSLVVTRLCFIHFDLSSMSRSVLARGSRGRAFGCNSSRRKSCAGRQSPGGAPRHAKRLY